MNTLRNKLIGGSAALLLVIIAFAFFSRTSHAPTEGAPAGTASTTPAAQATVRFGDTELAAEVAGTLEERMLGLSGRAGLEEGRALLFVFEEPGNYGIWMKDMLFPIDAIWLDETQTVVHIVENMRPESFPFLYEPGRDASYVVETNAGFARANGIKAGDAANIVFRR